MASSSGAFVPVDLLQPYYDEPAVREQVGPHAESDTDIPVELTVPGIGFVSSARLSVD